MYFRRPENTFCTHFALISANVNYLLHTFATLHLDAQKLLLLLQNCAQYHPKMEFCVLKSVQKRERSARRGAFVRHKKSWNGSLTPCSSSKHSLLCGTMCASCAPCVPAVNYVRVSCKKQTNNRNWLFAQIFSMWNLSQQQNLWTALHTMCWYNS